MRVVRRGFGRGRLKGRGGADPPHLGVHSEGLNMVAPLTTDCCILLGLALACSRALAREALKQLRHEWKLADCSATRAASEEQ